MNRVPEGYVPGNYSQTPDVSKVPLVGGAVNVLSQVNMTRKRALAASRAVAQTPGRAIEAGRNAAQHARTDISRGLTSKTKAIETGIDQASQALAERAERAKADLGNSITSTLKAAEAAINTSNQRLDTTGQRLAQRFETTMTNLDTRLSHVKAAIESVETKIDDAMGLKKTQAFSEPKLPTPPTHRQTKTINRREYTPDENAGQDERPKVRNTTEPSYVDLRSHDLGQNTLRETRKPTDPNSRSNDLELGADGKPWDVALRERLGVPKPGTYISSPEQRKAELQEVFRRYHL